MSKLVVGRPTTSIVWSQGLSLLSQSTAMAEQSEATIDDSSVSSLRFSFNGAREASEFRIQHGEYWKWSNYMRSTMR